MRIGIDIGGTKIELGAITHLLDEQRPTHAIGAAIMGGSRG